MKASKSSLDYTLISKFRALLMGVAIILIMFCHLDVAQNKNGIEQTRLAIYLHTGTVGVDMFVFLSGFGLYYSYSKKALSYWAFEKKRILRLLPYYFIIGGMTYLLYDIVIRNLTVGTFLRDLFFVSWYRDGSTKYWYVPTIMVFYLLFPGIFPFIRGTRHAFVKIVLFSIVWFAVAEILSLSFEKVNLFRIALERLPIFLLGIYAGKLSCEKRTVKGLLTAFFLFQGFLLFVLQTKVIAYPWSRYLYYPIRGALSISVITAVILLMKTMEEKAPRLSAVVSNVLAWFGGLTYELYLLHQSYMILLDFPYRLPAYVFAAFVLPTITAAGIFWVRRWLKKRQKHESVQYL